MHTGDDLLEAKIIMQDVVQMRRRIFGPAHPDTRSSEAALSQVCAKLAHAPRENEAAEELAEEVD